MWNPGDVVMWRGILKDRVWHVQPTIVVKDSLEELALILLPGTECTAEESYPLGKEKSKRWWDFEKLDWKMGKYIWSTNRLLLLLEPEKYYSTILFWDHESDQFRLYYINFQVPFKRNHQSIDTLDLELDLVIYPDFTYRWKDLDDYQKAIEHGIISPKYDKAIENAKPEIFERMEKRQYPYDGSWLNWTPDLNWSPPKLPDGWDKI